MTCAIKVEIRQLKAGGRVEGGGQWNGEKGENPEYYFTENTFFEGKKRSKMETKPAKFSFSPIFLLLQYRPIKSGKEKKRKTQTGSISVRTGSASALHPHHIICKKGLQDQSTSSQGQRGGATVRGRLQAKGSY